MEYVNRDILNLEYGERQETKRRTSFFKKHKAMIIIIGLTFVLIGFNTFLIHQFFEILNTL